MTHGTPMESLERATFPGDRPTACGYCPVALHSLRRQGESTGRDSYVLVKAPHSGYCPDGPHTGVAFVVERDAFETEYRTVEEWR